MPRADHYAGAHRGPAPGLRVTTEWQAGDVTAVMRVRGDLDADGSRILDHCLRAKVPVRCRDLVIDLSAVRLVSASGVRVLVEHTGRLALSGQRMLVVTPDPEARRALFQFDTARVLRCYTSTQAVGSEWAGPRIPEQPPRGEALDDRDGKVAELHEQIYGLRAALRVRPVVGRALGVLQERYCLTDVDCAFELLRQQAQRYNLTLYAVVRALLSAPPPQETQWFAGRARRPAPSLSFVSQSQKHKGNRAAILNLFAAAVSDYLRSPMVGVHLVDQADGGLWLDVHRNLPMAVVDRVAGHDDLNGILRTVVSGKSRVVVSDVKSEVDPELGEALRTAGVRSLQSTPLTTFEGHCTGVVTTFHPQTGLAPAKLQCAKLDHAATETADWLEWHHRTVVLDALESLHEQALERAPRRQ